MGFPRFSQGPERGPNKKARHTEALGWLPYAGLGTERALVVLLLAGTGILALVLAVLVLLILLVLALILVILVLAVLVLLLFVVHDTNHLFVFRRRSSRHSVGFGRRSRPRIERAALSCPSQH